MPKNQGPSAGRGAAEPFFLVQFTLPRRREFRRTAFGWQYTSEKQGKGSTRLCNCFVPFFELPPFRADSEEGNKCAGIEKGIGIN
ncbi:hypothetical protein chiPu_0007262 [Chiloscyllium punctatum]|uniref:Uncharacterized protein n=1 Tax=Chiloscyllium punctatum TaxID=137246 RepID=A0A401SEM0_CHIPU|nr:hypothetical protein [Chiloscyllium punctatum]